MKINWFPGHMTRALRVMQVEVKNVDVVLYILDARSPLACLNPEFDKIIANKPVLVVLNKIDMADTSKIAAVKESLKLHFKSKFQIVEVNSTASGAVKKVLEKIKILGEEKILKNKNKGLNTYIKAMVLGIPNSGKSTFVNNLCGKAKTQTGNRPGVTKGKQWVNISREIQILDTPGTLQPNLSDEKSARFLAYIGSISDKVLDINELAVALIRDIELQYPNALNLRYNVELSGTPYEKIKQIAISKNLVTKGGSIDYDRISIMILDDFRKRRLGNITLL
ncbi:MAG: ribosome biogenesis GTPase YlqF [Clostridia bacterium]|nr:ribosome biogenesis GTPase YlqF [Clostridia bacterium]